MRSLDEARTAGRVVVGVDGSMEARRAVRFAAFEAALRRVPLRVLTVTEQWVLAVERASEVWMPGWSSAECAVQAVLDEAVELAEETVAGLAVETAVRCGLAVPALVSESASADLLVVGNRGRGGVAGLVLGSVTVDLIARALCPVVVVRGAVSPARRLVTDCAPVVVGVDGGPHTDEVLEVAFLEAGVRNAPLSVVHTWRPTVVPGPAQAAPVVHEQPHRPGEELVWLDQALQAHHARHPRVVVMPQVTQRDPAAALLAAAEGAALVVVGNRGRGALAGVVLGSVSQAVVHRAPCPVLVVPVRGPVPMSPQSAAGSTRLVGRPQVVNV